MGETHVYLGPFLESYYKYIYIELRVIYAYAGQLARRNMYPRSPALWAQISMRLSDLRDAEPEATHTFIYTSPIRTDPYLIPFFSSISPINLDPISRPALSLAIHPVQIFPSTLPLATSHSRSFLIYRTFLPPHRNRPSVYHS